MKILYELVITEETGFTDKDFPDRFEILREKGKTPFVFKPVAINMQDIYNRLDEVEKLLKQSLDLPDGLSARAKHARNINEYFERYSQ